MASRSVSGRSMRLDFRERVSMISGYILGARFEVKEQPTDAPVMFCSNHGDLVRSPRCANSTVCEPEGPMANSTIGDLR